MLHKSCFYSSDDAPRSDIGRSEVGKTQAGAVQHCIHEAILAPDPYSQIALRPVRQNAWIPALVYAMECGGTRHIGSSTQISGSLADNRHHGRQAAAGD
jgi:hypothetical protein